VNAVGAGLDEIHYLVDTNATAIIDLAGTTSVKSAADNGKDDCIEEFLVPAIERTIYENR